MLISNTINYYFTGIIFKCLQYAGLHTKRLKTMYEQMLFPTTSSGLCY